MFLADIGKYRKALVVGVGVGYDIVSSVLVALYLQRLGLETDIGGMLNPMAVHIYGSKTEGIVNMVGADAARQIHSKRPEKRDFLDSRLPVALQLAGVQTGKLYNFSVRFGTEALQRALNELIERNDYDLLVGVDVGGDILGTWRDANLQTPMMDFAFLSAVPKLPCRSVLVVMGMSTDCELEPDRILEILQELSESRLLLDQFKMSPSDPEVKQFVKVRDAISTVRGGNTMRLTLEPLGKATADWHFEDILKPRTADERWSQAITGTLPGQTIGMAYIIDLGRLAEQRQEIAFVYGNPLEQWVKLKARQRGWKTELDLYYLWDGCNWRTTAQDGVCLQLLAPTLRIQGQIRKEMIEEEVGQMIAGVCDAALILREDEELIPKLLRVAAGVFTIVTGDGKFGEWMGRTAEIVASYQGSTALAGGS